MVEENIKKCVCVCVCVCVYVCICVESLLYSGNAHSIVNHLCFI